MRYTWNYSIVRCAFSGLFSARVSTSRVLSYLSANDRWHRCRPQEAVQCCHKSRGDRNPSIYVLFGAHGSLPRPKGLCNSCIASKWFLQSSQRASAASAFRLVEDKGLHPPSQLSDVPDTLCLSVEPSKCKRPDHHAIDSIHGGCEGVTEVNRSRQVERGLTR